MYKINVETGAIIFPDGFELLAPYNDERYYEYAKWVHDGNSPEEIEVDSLLSENNIEVKPDQARNALDAKGVLDDVIALMENPETPRFVKTKFEYTLSFARNDESVIAMAKLLKWDKVFLDELFELAKTLK